MEEIKEQIARHDEKIRTLFEQQKQIKSLAESTNRLAVSVEKMATQMANHEARIGEIEEGSRYKLRTVWACAVTGILGAAAAYLMTMILG